MALDDILAKMTFRQGTLLVFALVASGRVTPSSAQASPCRDTVRASSSEIREAVRATGIVADSNPPAIRICGRAGLFVVAGFTPLQRRRKDHGPRLFVLQATRTGSRILFGGRGFGDATVPKLYSITTGERTLILADLENEGSWGIAAYELVGDHVHELPYLDVGVPADPRSSDPDLSALPYLRGLWADGTWVIQLDTTVVLRPNQDRARRIVQERNGPIVFRLNGRAWRRQ